ncbi:MAG: tape measure protein, partial [Dolichospermum sp.]
MAATQDTQMEGDVSREILSNFNVMVRNRNLNQDQQGRALVALGQMASKGTIQTEELKGQLAEALPGSYQTFARSLGLNSKQFAKQLKLGNIESTDLTKFSQQAYAENILGIPRSMDTYGASVGKLNNSIMDLQESTGKVAMSFQKLINNLSASTLDLVSSNIDKIIYGLSFLIVVLSKAVWLPMIKGAMQFIKTLSLGQLALKGFSASVSLLINGLKRLTAEFLLFTAVTSAIDKLRISFSDLSGDLGKQIQQQTNLIKDYKSTVDSLGDRKPTRSYWDDLKVFGGSFVNNLPFIGDNGEKVKARRDTELKIAESRKNSSFLLGESDNILNNGSIDNLNRIDLKINKNQVNQRALIQFNPRDADGLKELKRQEKELLDIRRKTVLPIGKLQGNLSSQIEVKKNEIEYLKELKNDTSLYGFEIERNNKALAKSEKELENLEKAQTKITQAVGKTLTAYNLMQRQIRSVASDLEDRKSDLDSLATNKKTYLSGENIAGSISPGNLQLASSQLNISTLKQQFKADADAVSQYKSIFQLPDAQKVLQAFKVTGSTGIGRINQIIEGLENDKDKYVLQQFVEYQKLSRSLTQAESQIRDAQSGLADSLRSQTKQVADYYRTAVREAQAVSFEFQKAQKTLENSRMQNRLREALIGAGDNIYTQFIEGIINIISQTTEIQKQQFEARKQQIDYENNIQDIKLQASELQRSLPGKIIPIDSSLTDEFNLSLKNINTTVNTINTSIGKVTNSLSNEVVDAAKKANSELDKLNQTVKTIDNNSKSWIESFRSNFTNLFKAFKNGFSNAIIITNAQIKTSNWIASMATGEEAINNLAGSLQSVVSGEAGKQLEQGAKQFISNPIGAISNFLGVDKNKILSPIQGTTVEDLLRYKPSSAQGFHGLRDGGARQHRKIDFDSRVKAGQGAEIIASLPGTATAGKWTGNSGVVF